MPGEDILQFQAVLLDVEDLTGFFDGDARVAGDGVLDCIACRFVGHAGRVRGSLFPGADEGLPKHLRANNDDLGYDTMSHEEEATVERLCFLPTRGSLDACERRNSKSSARGSSDRTRAQLRDSIRRRNTRRVCCGRSAGRDREGTKRRALPDLTARRASTTAVVNRHA